MASPYPQLWDRAWLTQRYVIEGRVRREIAMEVGCSERTVSAAIAYLGLRAPRLGRRLGPKPVLRSKRQFEALYREMGSVPKLARHLRCDERYVRTALARFGTARATPPVKYDDRAYFADALGRGLTVTAIAAELGCERRSVYRALARFGLPRPVPGRADAVVRTS